MKRWQLPNKERVGLVERLHERGERVLELRGHGERLLALAGRRRAARQRLHALQVLEALLGALAGPERLVLPA